MSVSEEIITRIREEMAKTIGLIAEYEEMCKPIPPENSIGRISRMDAINNKSVTEASLRKAKEKLINLERALERSTEPGFGLCSGCGKPIPLQRILLMPQSRFCVPCAQKKV